jgi:hypothetical protein
MSCSGTGEVPTDFGMVDCPDCGGGGVLPSRNALVDWRSRDIERAMSAGRAVDAADATWLIAELRRSRNALTQIVALAHDVQDGDALGQRIRFLAIDALGLYDTSPAEAEAR